MQWSVIPLVLAIFMSCPIIDTYHSDNCICYKPDDFEYKTYISGYREYHEYTYCSSCRSRCQGSHNSQHDPDWFWYHDRPDTTTKNLRRAFKGKKYSGLKNNTVQISTGAYSDILFGVRQLSLKVRNARKVVIKYNPKFEGIVHNNPRYRVIDIDKSTKGWTNVSDFDFGISDWVSITILPRRKNSRIKMKDLDIDTCEFWDPVELNEDYY